MQLSVTAMKEPCKPRSAYYCYLITIMVIIRKLMDTHLMLLLELPFFSPTISSSHLAVTGPLRPPSPHFYLSYHISLSLTPGPSRYFPLTRSIQYCAIHCHSIHSILLVSPQLTQCWPPSSFSYSPPKKLETGLQRSFVLQYPLPQKEKKKKKKKSPPREKRSTV